MKKNIGGKDLLIRAVLGTAMVYYALSSLPGSDVWRVPAGIAGVVMWLTVLMSWCPLYKMLGFNTHSRGKTWSFFSKSGLQHTHMANSPQTLKLVSVFAAKQTFWVTSS